MSKPARRILAGCLLLALGAITVQSPAAEEDAKPKRVLRHVVLFKFKEDVTDAQVKEVEVAFAALPEKIDVIVDLEWGTDISPEGLAQGYTHCFFVSFADAAGRDAYLPHPEHQKFVDLVKPRLESVLVVDYWSR